MTFTLLNEKRCEIVGEGVSVGVFDGGAVASPLTNKGRLSVASTHRKDAPLEHLLGHHTIFAQEVWLRFYCFNMSGCEVVGIVLGSVPLIISALEHYAKGVSIVESSSGRRLPN